MVSKIHNLGFTLIELLISISIMVVLMGFTFLRYNSFNDQQRVKQTAETLKTNLRTAQTNAESGNKPIGCTTDTTLFGGYQVTFNTSSYEIVPLCGSDGTVPYDAEKVVFPLPSGVTISPAPIPATFIYYPLTRGLGNAPKTIVLNNGTFTYRFLLEDVYGPTVTNTPVPTAVSTLTPTIVLMTCNQYCVQFTYSYGLCKDPSTQHCKDGDWIPSNNFANCAPETCCCKF
jgi:prepilin-type N-terminal cleavage/methylation domain-containing protein